MTLTTSSPVSTDPEAVRREVSTWLADNWRPEFAARGADPKVWLAKVVDSGWAAPTWHLFVVRHPQRDALQQRLSEAGVGTLIHYPIPPHRQAAYADAEFAPEASPIASLMADEVLSLPMGPHLAMHDVARVIERARAR